jgi:hypothetical protein
MAVEGIEWSETTTLFVGVCQQLLSSVVSGLLDEKK